MIWRSAIGTDSHRYFIMYLPRIRTNHPWKLCLLSKSRNLRKINSNTNWWRYYLLEGGIGKGWIMRNNLHVGWGEPSLEAKNKGWRYSLYVWPQMTIACIWGTKLGVHRCKCLSRLSRPLASAREKHRLCPSLRSSLHGASSLWLDWLFRFTFLSH